MKFSNSIFLIFYLLVFSCVPKVEESDGLLSNENDTPIVKNSPPTADAGPNYTIKLPINSVVLNGSGSDSDGTIVSFSWSKRSNLAASLSNSNSASLSLSNLVEGVHSFRLTVIDNLGASAFDDVKVTVNAAPVVNSAPTLASISDISVEEGSAERIVNISASDIDNDTLTLTLNFAAALNNIVDFVDNGNGTAKLTINTQIGDGDGVARTLTATASDGALSASKNFKLTITPKPIVPPSNNGGGGWKEPVPPAQTLACEIKAGGCDMLVGSGNGGITINAAGDSSYNGKKVCIRMGSYGTFSINNLVATKAQPVTFINCGGQVSFRATAGNQVAIRAKRSRYVRVTGSGSSEHLYGIVAYATGSGGVVTFDQGSSDIEVDHIEMKGDPMQIVNGKPQFSTGNGLVMRTYPKTDWDVSCEDAESWSYGKWVQYNTNIHDNYIHDINNEAMYIGVSHFGPIGARKNPNVWTWSCTKSNGQTVQLVEAELHGVRIVNNRVENIGLDGIQVGGAVHSGDFPYNLIQGNLVKEFAFQENSNHAHGIQLGAGTRARVDSNWVENISGQTSKGIADASMGDTWYTNNIIVGMNDAIMVMTNSDVNAGLYLPNKYIYHNTVINSKNALYLFCNLFGTNDTVFMANNIFAGYERGIVNSSSCIENIGNSDKYYPSINSAGFVNNSQGNYHLGNSSPALNAGIDIADEVPFDHEGNDRSLRPLDLGAFIKK